MPADRFFVDTNVLIYIFDKHNAKKRSRANEWLDFLWQSGAGRLSWQVLHEFYVNAVRKAGVETKRARDVIELLICWQPVDTSAMLIHRAWFWMDQAGISYWDGLIVGAAEQLGCRWLLSEDFQTGRTYGATTIVNPFATSPAGPIGHPT